MDLKIIEKNLNKGKLKILKDTLGKMNPNIGRKLISWVLQHLVTPAGDLTPCPVSNIATHNLINSTFREGLASPLFKEICKNEHLLETEGMPCALFAHPEEVSALAKLVGAYKTDLDIL